MSGTTTVRPRRPDRAELAEDMAQSSSAARGQDGRAAARTRDLEGRIGDFYLNGFFTKAPSHKWHFNINPLPAYVEPVDWSKLRRMLRLRCTVIVFSLFAVHSNCIA